MLQKHIRTKELTVLSESFYIMLIITFELAIILTKFLHDLEKYI